MESTATPTNPTPAPVRPIPGFREQQRIKILRHYQVLDSPPEQEFDDLAALAAQVCGTPIAMISLVDEDRQWFKARYGTDDTETPREQSFCAHALHQPEMLIVPDATQDERFVNNPLVTGKPGIRFYAGAPLISPKNATLGTLCVIDRVPRQLTSAQEWVLQSLATRVMNRLERRRVRGSQKSPGVHDLQLDELRSLVCTNPQRCAMWGRLVSFLAWPILNGDFSHAYVEGDFLSEQPYPRDIDIILEPTEPYGPAAFAAIERHLKIGLDTIFQFHSVRLLFWIKDAPAVPSEYHARFPNAPLLKDPYLAESATEEGTARINLRAHRIVDQFHDSLDPYRT